VNGGRVDVSVVVPTRGRRRSLERCLTALARQALDEPFELVVVQDGGHRRSWLEGAIAALPNARLLHQPARGPGAARNTGVNAARGSLVCFTDDDCEAEPGWLAELTGALRSGVAAAAGATVGADDSNACATASQLVTEYVTAQASVPFAASNNLGCTAALAHDVPFDEGFRDAAGEDRDWCARVADRGMTIGRVPGARVVHRQRLTLRTFLAQQLRYGRGAHRYHRETLPARSFEPGRFYAGLLGRGFAAGTRVGLLVAVSQLAAALGFVLEAAVGRRAARH
jgi:glycosyltransferase involved in cell wall biosynthesis